MTDSTSYSLKVQAKAESLSVDQLQDYTLSIQVGIRDLQLCVTDSADNSLKLLEDYTFDGIKSVNTRIAVLDKLFNEHSLIKAGFWNAVKLSVKTHKFTLVPQSVFAKEAALDYLTVNCDIREKSEGVEYYKQISSDAVTVFALDRKLKKWMDEVYETQTIQVVHQGSALLEGILKYDDHAHDKMMFCYFDQGILHAFVTLKQKVLYYNQFAVRESQDYLKYIMLVFKELELNQKTTNVIVWGGIMQNSPHVELLRKYIRNISFGNRPTFLKTSYEFDEIPDHQYFDLLNIFLCD